MSAETIEAAATMVKRAVICMLACSVLCSDPGSLVWFALEVMRATYRRRSKEGSSVRLETE
jgi:hypothetical protein